MEVDAKVKELEDEVKVLKAEIRNVLLDIREAILDNTNPLSEGPEQAYLRLDLNTTARALASEEAARAARDAVDQARGEQSAEDKPVEPEADVPTAPPPEDEAPEEEAMAEEPTESEPQEAETQEPETGEPEDEAPEEEAMAEEPTDDKPVEPETTDDGDLPPKGKEYPYTPPRPTQIPSAAYLASLLPTGANGGLAAWVTEAMAAIGPQDLERVIAIHRLWGSLPPNISYALAHLQRLIRSSPKEADPPWLKTMRDLERLASC